MAFDILAQIEDFERGLVKLRDQEGVNLLEDETGRRIRDSIGQFNVESVDSCISQFVEAELDYDTPGDRGLGRISHEIPRYGAYFRKYFVRSNMEAGLMLRLGSYQRICTQILHGYLAHVFFAEEDGVKDPIVTMPAKLFEKWIPLIYSGALLQTMGEYGQQLLAASSNYSFLEHKGFLQENGMNGGGLFSSDKTDPILFHYPLAGFVLRVVEVGEI